MKTNTNDITTLQKEARDILREVLIQKDVVIKQLSKQIIDYQLQFDHCAEKIQNFRRVQAQQIDEHNLQDLINAGFIKNQESQFHLLIDVTQMIRQKSKILRLDSKAQIIKEVTNDSLSAYKQFNESYQILKNENVTLINQINQKDLQNQSIINSFKSQIDNSKEEYESRINKLQQRIDQLQQQKQMIELQSKQIQSQKSDYHNVKSDLKRKYDQKMQQCQEHLKKINDLNTKMDELVKMNYDLKAKIDVLHENNQELVEEQKQILQKYEQLEGEYNKFVTSSQDNDSFSKIRDFRKEITEVTTLQTKIKTLQQQCAKLKSQNSKYMDQIKKYQRQQHSQNNATVSPQAKVAGSAQRPRHRQRNKGKKMIRIGY